MLRSILKKRTILRDRCNRNQVWKAKCKNLLFDIGYKRIFLNLFIYRFFKHNKGKGNTVF